MTIFANILLFISSACIIGLNTGSLARSAPTGDASVGYAWSLIMLNLLFCIMMIIVSIITGNKGGYSWLPGNGAYRTLLVIGGLIAILVTSFIGTMFRNEMGATPGIVKTMISVAPWIIPAVLIIGHFILINNNIRINIPQGYYKWPLTIIGIFSMVSLVLMIGGFMSQANDEYASKTNNLMQDDLENQERMKSEIDSCDVTKNMVFILVMTDGNQSPDVMERAVAKVKSHPDYQAEIIRILQTGYVSEAFQFMASNDVDDPKRFPEPVRLGILKQAEVFRATIRASSSPADFYPELFLWETERILRTVEKYKGMGVDFKPAIIELRKSLNEKKNFERPVLKCQGVLDKWIKN